MLAAAQDALAREGAGTTGSKRRWPQPPARRTRWCSPPNLGIIYGLCATGDTVLLDLESHASIYDGARLSGAQVFAFRHNSPSDLARKLARIENRSNCLVIAEGLYSVSGDVGPLRELGYAVSNHDALRLLHFASRPYVFTASGSPATIAGVHKALDILLADRSLKTRLWENVRHVRRGLTSLGFTIGATESPIVPIEIGRAEQACTIWAALLEAAVYTNIVLPPACRPDAYLLRTSYSAAHTPAQIDEALGIFEQVEGAPDYGAVECDMPTVRAASAKTMPSRLKK